MRDILFRGKTVDTPEIYGDDWIEGSLIYIKNDKETVCKITDACLSKERGMMMAHDVDPETVCQYTGLTDRKGQKIFEGDIVKGKNDKGLIAFDHAQFCIVWKKTAEMKNADLEAWNSNVEVIGNRFDGIEAKMTLVMTVDIYTEESGMDENEIKQDIADFARGILLTGAKTQDVALTLKKVEYEGGSWVKE